MATGWIVWDTYGRKILSGPFTALADANASKTRWMRKIDSRETDKKSKDQSANITVETVTLL